MYNNKCKVILLAMVTSFRLFGGISETLVTVKSAKEILLPILMICGQNMCVLTLKENIFSTFILELLILNQFILKSHVKEHNMPAFLKLKTQFTKFRGSLLPSKHKNTYFN